MTWNHRIMKTEHQESADTWVDIYGMHEVYYDDEGKPDMYTTEPMFVWESESEFDWLMAQFIAASLKDVLTEEDFKDG